MNRVSVDILNVVQRSAIAEALSAAVGDTELDTRSITYRSRLAPTVNVTSGAVTQNDSTITIDALRGPPFRGPAESDDGYGEQVGELVYLVTSEAMTVVPAVADVIEDDGETFEVVGASEDAFGLIWKINVRREEAR